MEVLINLSFRTERSGDPESRGFGNNHLLESILRSANGVSAVHGSTNVAVGTPPGMEVVESSLEQRPRMPRATMHHFSDLRRDEGERRD